MLQPEAMSLRASTLSYRKLGLNSMDIIWPFILEIGINAILNAQKKKSKIELTAWERTNNWAQKFCPFPCKRLILPISM